MGYLVIERDNENMDGMRANMRKTMMRGGSSAMMRHDGHSSEHMYRMGYRHGWEDREQDAEDGDDMYFRRMRDSRGRYI